MKRAHFERDLRWSRGRTEQRDIAMLWRLFGDSCVRVTKTDVAMDKAGVDYIVTLRRGAEVYVDAKARKPGASRYWRYGEPDLQLESYSVVPMPGVPNGKPGWTLDEARNVDLILFSYDARDTDEVYIVSAHLLRMAFRRNYHVWRGQFPVHRQDSGRWQSECFFVPRSVVAAAVNDVQWGNTLSLTTGDQVVMDAFSVARR